MLKIRIIAVDKVRSTPFKEAQDEYLKRLGPYAKVSLEEVTPEAFGGSTEASTAMHREAEKLRKKLPSGAFTISMDPAGKKLTSEEFAAFLEKEGGTGTELAFIIGGTAGIDPELKKECRASISLSPMTFPHELARVLLAEQLYRAATILAGKSYHH